MTTPFSESLLIVTMQHIENNPDEHTQTWWRHQGRLCFASRAAMIAGATWVFDEDEKQQVKVGGSSMACSIVQIPGGQSMASWMHVEDYAMQVLGIDDYVADALFDGNATVADLRAMVDNLINYGSLTGDPTPQHQWEVTSA